MDGFESDIEECLKILNELLSLIEQDECALSSVSSGDAFNCYRDLTEWEVDNLGNIRCTMRNQLYD